MIMNNRFLFRLMEAKGNFFVHRAFTSNVFASQNIVCGTMPLRDKIATLRDAYYGILRNEQITNMRFRLQPSVAGERRRDRKGKSVLYTKSMLCFNRCACSALPFSYFPLHHILFVAIDTAVDAIVFECNKTVWRLLVLCNDRQVMPSCVILQSKCMSYKYQEQINPTVKRKLYLIAQFSVCAFDESMFEFVVLKSINIYEIQQK